MNKRLKNRSFIAALITAALIALGMGGLSPTLTPVLTDMACEAVECEPVNDGS